MAWKKIVQLVAVSACPKCGNSGFDLEPGRHFDDLEDPDTRVRCGECGYVCSSREFVRPAHSEQKQEPWRILKTVDLPDGPRKLVLFDWASHTESRLENLVLLDAAGMFVWAAELPEGTSPDCFVGTKVDEGTLLANTWSGYLVTLDPRTGKILGQQFAKRLFRNV